MLEIGFSQSKYNTSVFYQGLIVFLVYTDDTRIGGPNNNDLDKTVTSLKAKFDIDNQGEISDYLGGNIELVTSGKINLSQPHLINKICYQLGLVEGQINT